MSPLADPSANGFIREFTCGTCGFHQACRSRPRNFFERRLLPLLLLQPVRCQHCYRRYYIPRSTEVRDPPTIRQPQAKAQPPGGSKPGARVA